MKDDIIIRDHGDRVAIIAGTSKASPFLQKWSHLFDRVSWGEGPRVQYRYSIVSARVPGFEQFCKENGLTTKKVWHSKTGSKFY